jgi:hypothetical protein
MRYNEKLGFMDIQWIHRKCQEPFVITGHADEECVEDDISLADIKRALGAGEILEQYADRKDLRGDSCLMLGHGVDRTPIHMVLARNNSDRLVVVTVYRPMPPKWVNERTRRKI